MSENIKQTTISWDAIKQPFWALEINEIFETLATNKFGLSEEETQKRKKVFGTNEIQEKGHLTTVKIFFNQLKSPLILVLIGAGVVTLFLKEWLDAAVIFAAVIVNTILGFWQETKAEMSLTLLKTYIRTRSRVRREGREQEIDASDLVPGDIIRVSQGDRVPADARIFFSNSLEVDEAVLTGESLPVVKDVAPSPLETSLGDRKSMLWSGTLVVGGFGEAVVTSTGVNTEFGKIVTLVAERKREPTPLQKAIANFVARVGIVLAVLVLILFGLGLYFGYGIFEMFLIAVAVAVSAVPEGLPIALTVILAIGVQRMAKRKGVIRKLLAAETLGSTSLILTDKTGTLTQARMELLSALPYKSEGPEAQKRLLSKAILNTDVIVENPEEVVREWKLVGRPLETALVRGAGERGVKLEALSADILDRLPFSSEYKFSASVSVSGGKNQLVLLGAPEILLEYTNLSKEEKEKITAEIDSRALEGERILGVASKFLSADEKGILGMIRREKAGRNIKFKGLSFDGLLSFWDPLRPRVFDAVKKISGAGVKTVIVTGDHRGTAEAVGRSLGLVDGVGGVMTGDELRYLNDDQLLNRADKISVYARVTPEDKVKLVKLYKKKGEVVAVTGDGVNDAPALQAADIGIAVGSGTDVTKSAADLVILDDNFETIIAAIEEGRKILDNIRKVIVYLLSNASDELLLIGGALLTGLELPLSALQILFVNFFSDSFPAIALAFEEGVDSLGKTPRRIHKNLFDKEMRFLILIIGISTSIFLFVLYAALLRLGFAAELVRTFIFVSFATYALVVVFSIRSLRESILSYNPFSNLYLLGGVLAGMLLTAAVVYIPFLQKIFGTVFLPPIWLLGVLGVWVVNLAAIEFGKWLFRRRAL